MNEDMYNRLILLFFFVSWVAIAVLIFKCICFMRERISKWKGGS